MRIVELLNSIRLPITNEEAEILDRFQKKPELLKASLDERSQILANSLVNKDVLIRTLKDGQIIYKKRILN